MCYIYIRLSEATDVYVKMKHIFIPNLILKEIANFMNQLK